MFKEVGNSIIFLSLEAGAGVDPEANGGGGRTAVLSGHPQPAVQCCGLGGWKVEQDLLELSRGAGPSLWDL